jgi:hypothetical protein
MKRKYIAFADDVQSAVVNLLPVFMLPGVFLMISCW